ncbi:MAG: multiheme c-type cytochrome [Gammaproteobacteria bacterium]|nr:multiheme c-type cytochrome [Gammaproteobacteria bacterium]
MAETVSLAVRTGPRKLGFAVSSLFALSLVTAAYLGSVSFAQWASGAYLEDVAYQWVFLVHLLSGFAVIVVALAFVWIHLTRAIDRANRVAVRLGYSLLAASAVLPVTGVCLIRGMAFLEIDNHAVRETVYWFHVISPFVVCGLFALHRPAGPALRLRAAGAVAMTSVLAGLAAIGVGLAGSKDISPTSPEDFSPALARTSTGGHIAAGELMRDDYCARCHSDIHQQWQQSAHRFASFNNPAYLFSVRNTRAMTLERDGNVHAARLCAGCHDPVTLFSGAFDEVDFDDENHPTADAGITCLTCHSIEHINGNRGNADYVIGKPQHYPFAATENAALRFINGLLIESNPGFHKRTLLRPLHKTAEFCGTCHKVHLARELNHYRWLRGQNHYDSFLLSGVSGHGVQSFYYPERAVRNCAECHMPLEPSTDPAARSRNEGAMPSTHNHLFPGANTALAHLLNLPPDGLTAHRELLEGAIGLDIFALREGVEGKIFAPLRPAVPMLRPGATYVLDIVLRNLRVGHHFTEGTADSNEVWLDVAVTSGGEVIGRSGGLDPDDQTVDPWSHFVNAYVLDRNGLRIDRRNAEDIFAKLYDHQIPPGAADVVQYQIRIPDTADDALEIEAWLRYRKFDTRYLRQIQGDAFAGNNLPIVTVAHDRLVLPVAQSTADALTHALMDAPSVPHSVSEWERWNDYGIGLLRKPEGRALGRAKSAFRRVAALGQSEGDLNLARALLREGRLDDAATALRNAADKGAYPWLVAWFSGLIDFQNGEMDSAIERFERILDTNFAEARRRGFDFSYDYRVRNQLALALFERAKHLRPGQDSETQLRAALGQFKSTLTIDSENVTAHYGLAQVYASLGNEDAASHHRTLHETYRPDDTAPGEAVQIARRRNPAANHAANALAIYDLQRKGVQLN